MFYNKYIPLIFCFLLVLACEDEKNLSFSEFNITTPNNTMVDINIPEAIGTEAISNGINSEINNHIVEALHIGNSDQTTLKSVEESITTFNKEYQSFMANFPDSNQIWEAQIDGEVIFQSQDIITISLTSYINTGGAHGVLNVSILNFNPLTGKRISNADLTNNTQRFKSIAHMVFNNTINDDVILFEADNFTLPENIGYTKDGLLFIYNTYEIAPYSSGLIEFTIPFQDISDYLIFNSAI